MPDNFQHHALNLKENKNLVYTAMSKHFFYFRMFISKFVLEKGKVPLNPFMVFDYFLLDSIPRELVIEGNNNLVKRADELWVFGQISNGVLAEILIAKEMGKPIKYFKIEKPHKIIEIEKEQAEFEDEVKQFTNLL